MRLARTEVDHIDSVASQLLGFCDHGHCGGTSIRLILFSQFQTRVGSGATVILSSPS